MKRNVLFVQLPIPPAGPSKIVGNIPLAAGYMILYARKQGLDSHFHFQILANDVVDQASDCAVVQEILDRKPWMVGFTCYLWNISRTLWIAARLKQANPDLKIVLGGPEITADNAWVLDRQWVDYAVVGEGEQTFTQLLTHLQASGGFSQSSTIL